MGAQINTGVNRDNIFLPNDWDKEALNRGKSYYSHEQYQQALIIFNQLMSLDSKNFEYVFQTACTQKKLKIHNDSLNNFQKAVNIRQNHAQSYYKKVNLYFKLQKFDLINHIDREIKGILDAQDVNNIYGKILYKQKKYQEAISIFKFFIITKQQNFGTNLFALKQLGKIHFTLNQIDDGVKYYQQILFYDPKNFFANKILGFVLYEKQQYQQAITHFDICIKLKNNNPSIQRIKLFKLQSLFKLQNYKEVIQINNDLTEQMQREAYWLTAQSHYHLEEYGICKNIILLMLEYSDENKEAIHLLGECYYYLDQYNLCVNYLEPIIKLYPDSAEILGISYLKLFKYQEAIDMFNQAIDRDRDFLQTYELIERKFYDNMFYEESQRMLKKVIQLFPLQKVYSQRLEILNSKLSSMYGISLFQKQKYQQVISYCQYITNHQTSEMFLKLIGYSYLQLGDYQKCEDQLLEVLKINKTNDFVKYYLGVCIFLKKQYKEAMQLFCEINLRQNEFLLEKTLYLGKCQYYVGNYYDALEIFNSVLNQERMNFEAMIFQAQCYFKLNKFVQVIAIAQDATDSNLPDKTFMIELQGLSLYNLSKFDKAITLFDQILQKDRENSTALYYKGLSQFRLKNYNGLIDTFKSLIKHKPHKKVHYYQGYLDIIEKLVKVNPQNKESYQKAILASSNAIQLESLDIDQLNRQALILYRDQQLDSAKQVLQKVLIFDASNIIANTYLSQIMYEQGDFQNARKMINIVLDQDQEHSYALYIKGIILYSQLQLQESLQIFELLQKLEPLNLNVKNNIAQIFLRQNNSQKAIQLAKEILLMNPEFLYAKLCLDQSIKSLKPRIDKSLN